MKIANNTYCYDPVFTQTAFRGKNAAFLMRLSANGTSRTSQNANLGPCSVNPKSFYTKKRKMVEHRTQSV
jgi:hypothetical protein